MDFSGKVAIVTGAASGMGAAVARLLCRRSAEVVVVDVDEPGLASIAGEIGARPIPGDVSVAGFGRKLVDEVVDEYGHVDILVNAAGIIIRAPAHDTTDEDWRRIFSVNVDGVFFLSRAAATVMRHQRSGSIVNFGSIWGDLGNSGHAAYTATKGAVHQLTKSMALELADAGIRVNAVAPGEIRTPMLASGRDKPMSDSDLDALGAATVPIGRLGEPDEIAEVVAFLASDASSYMTGSIVVADAGYSAR